LVVVVRDNDGQKKGDVREGEEIGEFRLSFFVELGVNFIVFVLVRVE